MVLSAVAELHEHLDSSSCKVVSTPVWANIHPDDPHSKNSPLYPLTKGYGQVLPAAEQPRPGPSKGKGKEKAVKQEDSEDDHGCQLERSKHPHHTMSTRGRSANKPNPRPSSLVMMTWNWIMCWQCLNQCWHL